MKVIGRPQIGDWIHLYPQAKSALQSWLRETEVAVWPSAREIQNRYIAARIGSNDIVIFPLCAAQFHIETRVYFPAQTILVVELAICRDEQFALQLEVEDTATSRRSTLLTGGHREH